MDSWSPGLCGSWTNVARFQSTLETPSEPKEGSVRYLPTDTIPTTRETSASFTAIAYQGFPGDPAHLALTMTPSASLQELIDANVPL
jgi:hypothetical protein